MEIISRGEINIPSQWKMRGTGNLLRVHAKLSIEFHQPQNICPSGWVGGGEGVTINANKRKFHSFDSTSRANPKLRISCEFISLSLSLVGTILFVFKGEKKREGNERETKEDEVNCTFRGRGEIVKEHARGGSIVHSRVHENARDRASFPLPPFFLFSIF